jgi:hypothetical protein
MRWKMLVRWARPGDHGGVERREPGRSDRDEWRLVERAVGIDRGWNAAY